MSKDSIKKYPELGEYPTWEQCMDKVFMMGSASQHKPKKYESESSTIRAAWAGLASNLPTALEIALMVGFGNDFVGWGPGITMVLSYLSKNAVVAGRKRVGDIL